MAVIKDNPLQQPFLNIILINSDEVKTSPSSFYFGPPVFKVTLLRSSCSFQVTQIGLALKIAE